MQLKSYFAGTIEAAMARATHELGEDAMLVNSSKTSPEARHLGKYEVVFATEPLSKARLAELLEAQQKQSLEELARRRRGTPIDRGELSHSQAQLAELQSLLEMNEIDPELAASLVESAAARAQEERSPAPHRLAGPVRDPLPFDRRRLLQALTAEMESRIQVDPTLGQPDGNGARIIALVGPPGRGKTTTLIKLAVRFGLASRVPVRLLSMDTYRIAAAEQMRSFASILGVPYQSLETCPALEGALSESRHSGLVFIDTPGYGPQDMEATGELANFFARRPDIDRHLVLRIDMKAADTRRAVERFSIFGPGKLIFTGLDEAEGPGAVFGEAVRAGMPVSFLGTGQQIPEDIEMASRQRIIEMALRRQAKAAAAAA